MNRAVSTGFFNLHRAKSAARQLSRRSLFCYILALAFILPPLFVLNALTTLEKQTICANKDCLPIRKWGPLDSNFGDSRYIFSLLLEAANQSLSKGIDIPESFNDLIAEIRAKNLDSQTSILKLRAMVETFKQQTMQAKVQQKLYKQYASTGIPKGLHCLSLKLTTEYTSNARARHELPAPELVPHLVNNSFYHFVMVSDNVLAASVVVSSTVKNAKDPSKTVFHVITDKKTYAAMHAWFALYPVPPAIVEVKGIHQFLWLTKEHVSGTDFSDSPKLITSKPQGHHPTYTSILNYLHVYFPELFSDLNKIVLLEDDVVVQGDLSGLWDVDMEGKVIGAVEKCQTFNPKETSKQFGTFVTSKSPWIKKNIDEKCVWAYGMNILDLEIWRKSGLTKIHHQWVKREMVCYSTEVQSAFRAQVFHQLATDDNVDSNLTLLQLDTVLPSFFSAFDGHVHPIDRSWHMLELGYQSEFDVEAAKRATLIHYSGHAKPWLEISFPNSRPFWTKYVDYSNEFIRHCNVLQ